MAIEFVCPTCTGTLQVADEAAGRVIRCGGCQTMLRVPEEKSDDTFKCPVDGTTMEKRKGRGFAFFFDDDVFESHDM